MRASWAMFTVAAILLASAGGAGAGEMYKCKNAKGGISFSDAPCAAGDSTVDRKLTNDTITLGKEPPPAAKTNATSAKTSTSTPRPITLSRAERERAQADAQAILGTYRQTMRLLGGCDARAQSGACAQGTPAR